MLYLIFSGTERAANMTIVSERSAAPELFFLIVKRRQVTAEMQNLVL